MLNFDFLESSNSQYTGSQSTINHLGTSMSSMSGVSIAATGRRQPTGTKRGSIARRNTLIQSSPVFSESGAIAEVAEAQSSEERALRHKRKLLRKKSSKNMMDANKLDPHELLTPIREFQEEDAGLKPEAKGSKISTADAKSYISMSQPKPKLKKEVDLLDSKTIIESENKLSCRTREVISNSADWTLNHLTLIISNI